MFVAKEVWLAGSWLRSTGVGVAVLGVTALLATLLATVKGKQNLHVQDTGAFKTFRGWMFAVWASLVAGGLALVFWEVGRALFTGE
jgi:hypothetical protein